MKCSSGVPRGGVLAAALVAALATTAAGQGRPYTFQNVADDSGPLGVPFGLAVINDAGVVAFRTSVDGRGEGIARGTAGGPVALLAANFGDEFTGGFSTFNAINDAGTVAFNASRGVGIPIFTRTDPGTPATQIPASGGGEFSINNAGTVAYGGNGGVAASDAVTTRSIYQAPPSTPENPQPFRLDIYPSINDAGTVVFGGMIDNRTGVYVGDGSGPVRLLLRAGEGPVGLAQQLAINNPGQVVMSAFRSAGGTGIYVIEPDGQVRTIADDTGPFQTLYSPSINDRGDVVFRALLDDGGQGLFTGPDPVADKVIGFGDTLFGSPVNFLDVYRDSINDAGTVVFNYGTANGRQGIAVAVVPEPGAALGALALAGAVLSRRRTRRG